jgi:hypothetical protein
MIYREKKINSIIDEINSTVEKKNEMVKQAQDEKVELETILFRNADFMYKQKAGLIQ